MENLEKVYSMPALYVVDVDESCQYTTTNIPISNVVACLLSDDKTISGEKQEYENTGEIITINFPKHWIGKQVLIKYERNSVPNWDTHGVIREDGTINVHTHGLEKYGLKNLEMICENEKEAQWGAEVLGQIAMAEIDEGKQYTYGQRHVIDDDETLDIIHVFKLEKVVDEYGDTVAMVDYIYGPVIHPSTGKMYMFNEDREWVWIASFD